ncbi:MAG: helicase-associated domain-containing protein [Anaerolineae bacterium]
MLPLRQCLLDTYVVHLRAIAGFWGIELTARRQREMALELAEAMVSPEAVTRVWKALPSEQQEALRELIAADGRMPQRVFARRWGEIRAMGPGKMERERPWREPVSPAEGLWYTGLIFRTFEQGPDGTYGAIIVPSELHASLPVAEVGQPRIVLEPATEPAIVRSLGDYVLDDTCTLLSYVQTERPRLRSNQRWPEQHEQALRCRLRIQDPGYFALLGHVSSAIGWLLEDKTGRLRLQPEPVTAWLRSAPFDQQRTVARAWLEDSTWNDLFHIPALHPEDTGAWRNDPVLARRAVLQHLESCRPDTWYGLNDLVTAIKHVDADFQRPDGDYESWYIRDEATGVYLSGFGSWDAVEGRLIRYLIRKALAWLGLVDLGAEGDSHPPSVFRLSGRGAALLELAEPTASPEGPPAHLQSGFRVAVPDARRYERFQLARVADWLQSGSPFFYRLTPSSLERARGQGIPVTRVLEFLGDLIEAPVPRSVEAALTRWDARGAEARLERVVVMRISSEELLDQVIASPALGRLIGERLGPTSVTVRSQDCEKVIGALGEMGILPEVDDLTAA